MLVQLSVLASRLGRPFNDLVLMNDLEDNWYVLAVFIQLKVDW